MTIDGFGCLVLQRLVRAFGVVKLKVVVEAAGGLGDGSIRFQKYIFIFHRSPQSFGKDVVHAPTSAIHADAHILFLEWSQEQVRGKVRSLIRIADLRSRDRQSAIEGGQTKWDL